MIQAQKPIKVLLVEDSAYDTKVVEDLFCDIKGDGFLLRTAESLHKAKETDVEYRSDIVLLDLNLPDSYGTETLIKSKDLFPDRPIIVMTGLYEERLGVQLIKKGAQDYMVKGKLTASGLAYGIKYAIERGKTEVHLKERETSMRNLLEKIPEGFLVVLPDGSVTFANLGAELLLGRKQADIMADPFDLQSDLETPIETEIFHRDGTKVPVEIMAAELNWGGEACRLIMLRDLTTARQLQRNRDEFISRISHELRSPLTVVREALDLVYDGTAGEASERQKEILKMGLDNTGRLNRLIDALLDITKMEAGVMPMDEEHADLGELLSETAGHYTRLAADRGIKMTVEIPDEALTTYCDTDKLCEVLVNLVSNALKFTPPEGRIKLSLRHWETEALICVENSGSAIEPEDLPKLFTKFAQLNSAGVTGAKGTGLGLAISRGIIQMHGGRLWAESEPGETCKFYVLLPLLGFREAVKRLTRREIEFAGKRQFCALNVALPEEVREKYASTGAAPRVFTYLKAALRNSHSGIRNKNGDFTMFLPNSGLRECAKGASAIHTALREKAGLTEAEAAMSVGALVYPEDFRNEEDYVKKIFETRGEGQ